MNLLNRSSYRLLLLIIFLSMSFCIYASETPEGKAPEVITQLFQIKNSNIDEVKEKINELLTKDKDVNTKIETFSLQRPEGEVKFLLVEDTSQKIQEISSVIEKIEEGSVAKTIDLDFSDVPLNQILATVARVTDLNIIGGEELSQKISIHLKNIPMDDVFDIILKSSGYTYLEEDNVIRIISKDEVDKFLITEVFELKFVSAKKVAEATSHLLTANGKMKPFSNFSDDKYSNCLVITDTPESVDIVKGIVKKLDRKIKQVMIEAKFCEVTLDKDDEFGIDFVLQASISGASAPTTLPFGSRGKNIPGRPTSVTPSSTTFTVGTVSFSNFSATLKALDTETKVNLVASPRVATRDGEEAEIIIGDKVPIPLYERNEQTGSIEVTGYQDQDIGVLLRVTPIVNIDNSVTLVVHPEVSEITSYTGPNNERPVVSTREVTTSFTVGNGKTMVIGGLMKETITNTYHQIPILGNLPFLGRIFRYKDDSKDTKDLLVFITPTIIDEAVSTEETDKTTNSDQTEGHDGKEKS